MHHFRHVLCGVALLGALACQDTLVVENQNEADRERVIGSAADLENFLGAAYAVVQNATLGGSNDALQTQLQVMGMENTSALANFAMGPRGLMPRTPIDNQRNGTGNTGNFRDFLVLHRAARQAAIGIAGDSLLYSLSQARGQRAHAFGRFVQGVALGNLALAYDSASILREDDDPQAVNPLSHYSAVMAAALAYLDSAIAIASGPVPPGADWFPLPATWINGNALTAVQFVQFARSYKARLRADVSRSPAERAAVDWNQVIADASAGIIADFNITMNPNAGWDVIWPLQAYATGAANWHQMSQFWLGMADSTGAYDAWLATPRANRVAFLVVTADRRFPRGTTRAAQNTDTATVGTFTSTRYFRNRPSGEDQPGDPLQISQYDYYRSRAFRDASRIGPYPVMTAAEIRLLRAEGELRAGNVAAAAALIDVSRIAKGQLPSLVTAGITDTVTVVPGGVGCVPRRPAAPSFTSAECGRIWDALKWEYRMETAYAGYGKWYFAARGWGDLPEGTAIHWPVPNQEMDTRSQPFYGLGGVGDAQGSAAGNYGLFGGGVYPP